MAAVFMLTLSAPALSKVRISLTARTPPPTVRGINTSELSARQFDKWYLAARGLRYIEKGDFVGAGVVVATRDLNRVTCITNADEIDALNHAPLVNIQAGNDSLRERH